MKICNRCKTLLAGDARVCPTDGAHTDEVDQLPAGAKLGQYQIKRLLGEGGMGFVYEAVHEVLGRRTAIKFLRPEFVSHPQVVTRFLQEAKAVNLIDHGNIINVYDYGDGADGSVYFVMEFLEGETLDDLMRKRRPMPATLLLHVFAQIAKALAAAHAKKIVHRDLKPVNVYVIGREGNPYFIKLLDFGIAQLRGEGEVKGLTVAGSIMGTPQFMSPEQISGATVDVRTDIWAFGVMLYKAATGIAPFRGEGFGQLAGVILHDSPKRPRDAAPDAKIAPALDALIMRCLERDVAARYASITDVLDGFAAVKRDYGLDDDAITAAIKADAGAISEALPLLRSEPTRQSLAGSSPRYQGVGPSVVVAAEARHRAAKPKGKRGLAIGVGAAVVVLGAGSYAVFGRTNSPERVATAAPQAAATVTRSIKERFSAGDLPGAQQLAERGLHEAIASGSVQLQGQAVDGLAQAPSPAGAPLLYLALKGSPELRVKAARALGDLGLPDGAPKVRAALDDSGDKVRVEIAASLSALGDKDALAILKRAVGDPGMRLTAALALAHLGDAQDARPVLVDILEATPEGREQWRRAAGGLVQLGDAKGEAALTGELVQPDASRAVAAADLLAKHGDDKAHAYLSRVAADPEFTRRGEAASALARLGDPGALGWVKEGLGSSDVEERKLAIATCARLAKRGGDRFAAELAGLATDDTDGGVRLAAEAALLVL